MSKINLLPWRSEKIFQKNNIFYLITAVIIIVFMLLMFVFRFYIQFLVSVNNKSIQYLNSEIIIYQNKAKEIDLLKERKKILINRLEVINSLQAMRFNLVNILDKIASALPGGTSLTNMEMLDDHLIISGQAESNSNVSLFMRNLAESKLFCNLKLQEIKASQIAADHSQFILFVLAVSVLG